MGVNLYVNRCEYNHTHIDWWQVRRTARKAFHWLTDRHTSTPDAT